MDKILLISDIHLSATKSNEEPAYSLVKKVAQTERFSAVVNLGDTLDLEACSKFVDGLPGITEGQRLSDDLDYLEQELVFWKKICKKSILLQGNHDVRLEILMEKNPYLKGSIPTFNDICEDTGTTYIPLIEQPKALFDNLPSLYFAHGFAAGESAATQTLKKLGSSIVFGHVHRSALSSWKYPNQNTTISHSIGTLGELYPRYTKGKRWLGDSQSFGVLYIDGNDYQLDIIQINERKCIIAGKAYSV